MAKVWSGRDGGRGCCEEVEAKGQVSRVGGHGVVSQARGADLKPPSPVGSARAGSSHFFLHDPTSDPLHVLSQALVNQKSELPRDDSTGPVSPWQTSWTGSLVPE